MWVTSGLFEVTHWLFDIVWGIILRPGPFDNYVCGHAMITHIANSVVYGTGAGIAPQVIGHIA